MAASESKIWIYMEHRQGRLADVSLELVQKGFELGKEINWKVAGLLVGSNVSGLAEEALTYGLDEVLLAEDPLLDDYCSQSYTKVVEAAVRENNPEVFLLGATTVGLDLGARLAARLRTGLSAHGLDLELTARGELRTIVPGWGGDIMAGISCPHRRPQMATVKPGTFDLPQPGQARGRIVPLKPVVESKDITYRVVEAGRDESRRQSSLDTAEIVVAGGWGVGSEENWRLIEDLASALGGAVGATRPPVDEGWAEEIQMIGTSGRTVRPKLYIGVALSGHMHHLVGVKKPGFMVGINQDRNAPIFSHCDLGLVGDFKEILPILIREIKSF